MAIQQDARDEKNLALDTVIGQSNKFVAYGH